MWKKALLPLLLIAAVLLALVAAAYFYETKWGQEGPFPDSDHHGHHH